MSISNSNFYVDVQSINDLQTKYNESIKVLTDLYFNFENQANEIESQELWQGNSYEKFKEIFDKWKIDYLQRLTEIIQLKDLLEEVIAVTEILIAERNGLPSSLEVNG